jgi:cysteine-rich repeat protein
VPSQPSLFIRGAITPGSDVDIYRLTVTGTADLRLDTFDGTYDGSGSGSCADSIDTLLELLNADGAVLTSDDDGGIERCSSLQPGLTPGVARLPAGTYFLRVRSYNASSIPAYTLRIQFEALCGDGTRQAPEQCDDGNTAGGDACPATCRPEKVPEVENNDTAAMAQALASLPSLIGGAISPGSDSDMFRFTLNATADVEIETYDGSYTGTHIEACQNIDTYLELIAANGTTTIASDDDNGIDNCSSLTPPTSRAMRRMAPGTYFARVTSFWGSELPAYSVAIRYRALCGDGAVTGSEECDGGAGCSATCERTPNCGDGYLDYPEACEDGNTTNGDGCSSTCQIPGLSSEVEPNNTRAEADARATGSSPVLITGTTGISSAFQTYEDVDVYKLQLQSARTVKLETFHGGLGRCTPDLDTVVRLTNASGAQVGSNDDGGPGSCSLLEISLQAGTYYVTVDRVGSEDSESYALQVTFQ